MQLDCKTATGLSNILFVGAFLGLTILYIIAMFEFTKTEDTDVATGKFMKILLHPASIATFGTLFVASIALTAISNDKCGLSKAAAEEMFSSTISLSNF